MVTRMMEKTRRCDAAFGDCLSIDPPREPSLWPWFNPRNRVALGLDQGWATSVLHALDGGGLAKLAGITGLAESCHPGHANFLHGRSGWLQIVAWIEFFGMLHEHFADSTRHRHAIIGIHIDLAYPVLDASLNFLDRNSVGLLHLTAELVDEVLKLLGHR